MSAYVKHKELKAEFVFFPLFLALMLSHTVCRSPFLSVSLSLFFIPSLCLTFYHFLFLYFTESSHPEVFCK